MQDPSLESRTPPLPPVLDYARPSPPRVRLLPPGRTPKFTILFGIVISGTLILVGVGLLMLGAVLCWSSVEVNRNDSAGMQLGGCYALLVGVVLLIVGMAGRRMALRQWRAR